MKHLGLVFQKIVKFEHVTGYQQSGTGYADIKFKNELINNLVC